MLTYIEIHGVPNGCRQLTVMRWEWSLPKKIDAMRASNSNLCRQLIKNVKGKKIKNQQLTMYNSGHTEKHSLTSLVSYAPEWDG